MRECESNSQEIIIHNNPELSRKVNEILNCPVAETEEFNFGEMYQTDEIKRDKEKYKGESDQAVKELTKSIFTGATVCDWFGPEMSVICPSKYDAGRQEIHLIAECSDLPENQNDEPIVLAISVEINPHTHGCVGVGVNENPAEIKQPAELKKIPIKYFQSPIYGTQSSLESVVSVKVAVNETRAGELNDLLKKIQKLAGNIRDTGFNNEVRTEQLKEMIEQFSHHPARQEILEEISAQLEFFIEQTDTKTKNGAKLQRRLKTLNEKIGQALLE